MSEKKRFRLGPAVVNFNAMKLDIAEAVVDIANTSLRDNMTEQEVATDTKKKLVARYPDDIWQVLVGRNFGSYVTHVEGKYIYFYIGQIGFCVFAA